MGLDSFLQVLKIESDEFVVDEEETILLKADYWKDMVSGFRLQEYHSKILEEKFMYGGDEWGFDFEKDTPLDEKELTPSQKENRTEARRYLSMVKDAEAKYKKAYPHEENGEKISIAHPFFKEVMDAKEVKEFQKTQAKELTDWEKKQTKKQPKKKEEKKKKRRRSTFFMNAPSTKKVVEEKPSSPTNFNLKNRSIEDLESELEAHEYKDLTDDKINERVSKLSSQIGDKYKKIESKGRGGKQTYTKAAWKEYQKLISEVKQIENETNSFPNLPTIEDAKSIRSKSKLQNLGLKVGATNTEKLNALKRAYEKELKEVMTKRKEVIDKKKDIADFNKKHRVGSTHAQNRLKSWIEERDSLLILIALKSQISYVKFQNITDKLTTQEPEQRDFKDVPDSLYSFVSKALSEDNFKELMSVIERLNVLHVESQGEQEDYLEEIRKEIAYRGGESNEHKDKFHDFLIHRLEKFFRPIKTNNNAIMEDRKRNIEKLLSDIITHDKKNTAFIISEDVIQATETLNENVREQVKRDEDFRQSLRETSNLLDNAFRNVKEFYNKFDYDVSQPRSKSSEDALIFRMISQEVAGMSSQETFDSLEERNFFTDKNLYKLAKIISILDEGRSEKYQDKALAMEKHNQVTNHLKVVKVLNKDYAGEVGHRIFLRILNEHGLELPSVSSLKDASRAIVSRSTNIQELEQELVEINQIFDSPSMTDDLSFLMKPKYVQQMLDLAERSYLNAIYDIDSDTDSQQTLPMKIRRKEKLREVFGKLAFVGYYLNTISRGTEFLYSVDNQIIISNKVLQDMGVSYPELKSKYGDTLDAKVKRKIKQIVSGKEMDSETGKPIKFGKPKYKIPETKPESTSKPKKRQLPEKPTEEEYQRIREKWRGDK